jgi:hypothetical protein
MVGFYFILIIISYFFYLNQRKISFFSVVDVFVIFYTIVIVSTFLYHFFYPKSDKINLYGFDLKNNTNFDSNIVIFLKWLFFFLLGHLFFKLLHKNYRLLIKEKTAFKINHFFHFHTVRNITWVLLFFSVVLVYLDYGLGIFQRVKYIPYESSYFKLVYSVLFLGVSFFSGYYFRYNRLFYTVAIGVVLLINLSIGSRLASINLVIFLFSFFINYNKKAKFQIFISLLFMFFFFGYNLSLRSEAHGHGLIPYLQITFQKPEIIVNYTIKSLYYTFVFGFYATVETVKYYNENILDNLIISLNPLTGGMANWYLIVDKMKLNNFAPFTGIGILYKHNYFFFVFTFFIGYFFSFIDLIIKKNLKAKKYLQPLILLLFCTLFSVLIFEYNLRNASRYIYYSIFIIIIFKFNYRNGKIFFKI